ncbi:MAG: AAA family ATPase [Mucilaginibacter sp.]|uniref:exopolysaccharide transport family protein n=1 Tax=Mucilaginibacter sp. TaxID=1882438 RepID=UPI003263674C
MELADFVALLKRYKLILIIVPVLMVVVCYYMVRNLPDSYVSQTLIATGIVDQSQKLPDVAIDQESQVFIKFSNLITMMKMQKVQNQVSYLLILHDLTSDVPFRKHSKLFHDLVPSAKQHAIDVFTKMYNTHGALQTYDVDQAGLNQLISSMHYDMGSLLAKTVIYRNENSDFIQVSFESENPQLSAFVVNKLVSEFITFQGANDKQSHGKSIHLLDSLMQDKKKSMDVKNDSLKKYKIDNHILNITDQASSLYSQIADYQGRQQLAEQQIAANNSAINNLNDKLGPTDRNHALPAKIISNREALKTFTDRLIKSGYNPYYKAKVDSIQSILTDQISESVSQSADNPLSTKQNLISQKLRLEIDRDIAKGSVPTIHAELANLKSQLDKLVPFEAVIESLQSGIERDSKDYLDILGKYNQATTANEFSTKIRQVDMAMPGGPAPSKKMLLTIGAGIVTEIVLLLIMFILFYLDDSIKQPKALANKSGLPVLGHLNVIKGTTLDLRKIWDIENRSKMQQFKDLLRSIRFEIDQELHGNKILAITSLGDGDGKTLLAISLAYSYSIINKKVLLIDGNFSNPTISSTVQPKLFIEDYFRDDPDYRDVILNTNISVLGNQGNDITLLEIENERIIQQKFLKLKSMYDIIIIEVQDMAKMNKAKEWLLFADKTIAVFEANQKLDDSKLASVKYFKTLGTRFAGWVFNKAASQEK